MGRGPVGEPAIIKYVNNSLASVDDVSNTDGAMILIKTLTASSSATLSFVDGTSDVVLDNTYPIYKFVYTSIHPSSNGAEFQWQANAAGGSGYNETHTSTHFQSAHNEGDTDTGLSYTTSMDSAQGTGGIILNTDVGADNDQSCSGDLWIFNPSSTTFVKHFMSRSNRSDAGDYSVDNFHAGYINATAAIDEVQFSFNAGNIDAGTIKLYGIKDS